MQNLKKYQGMWIALCNNKVIASGKDAFTVYKKAKHKTDNPIIFQVPTKEEEVCIL